MGGRGVSSWTASMATARMDIYDAMNSTNPNFSKGKEWQKIVRGVYMHMK